jgi:hypothetical protein
MKVKISKNVWQAVGKTAGWTSSMTKTAGDEWVDDNTKNFVRQLAEVMNADKEKVYDIMAPQGHEILFWYIVKDRPIKLKLSVMEFGYAGEDAVHSESLNGTITAPTGSDFLLPGGTTRTRNPNEFWNDAKRNLDEIFAMALDRR